MQSDDKNKESPADILAKLCFAKFNNLPKTGKPTAKEWTVLAAIIAEDTCRRETKVVAIGTGTKCIGKSKLCKNGLILNDSHAEVLARRAFLRYIYHELRKAAKQDEKPNNIFEWNRGQMAYRLRRTTRFHFFSTQTPCGDACIVDNCKDGENADDVDSAPPTKKAKTEYLLDAEAINGDLLPANDSDIVFTGAKIIDCHVNDDILLQTAAAIRTKPGRGDRTLSVSCSDKLSKWNVMGVQGALLDMLLAEPIYLDTLTFCCDSDRAALERAIYGRWLGRSFASARFKPNSPEIRICSSHISFAFKSVAEKQPSPNGLSWCDIEERFRPFEVTVNGKRQGVTKKKLNTPQAASMISKYHLLNEFIGLLRMQPFLCERFHLQVDLLEKIPYSQFKALAQSYQQAWSAVKSEYFLQWTKKPSALLQFVLEAQKKKSPKPAS